MLMTIKGAGRWLCLAGVLITTPAVAAVNIVRQDLTLDLTGSALSVVAEVEIEGVVNTKSVLLVMPSVPVTSATAGGTALAVTPHPQNPSLVMIVELPQALAPKQRTTLTFKLEGTPDCSSGLCMRSAALTFFVPYWGGVRWYLINAEARDVFDAKIAITVPADHEVLCFGAPQVTEGGGTRTWTFAPAHPTEDLALLAGQLERVDATLDLPATVLFAAKATHAKAAEAAAKVASQLSGAYAKIWGVTPTKQVGVGFVPRSFPWGGVGLQGTVLINEAYLEASGASPSGASPSGASPSGASPDLLDQAVAHELGHTWWGNYASSPYDSSELPLLHESLAEYTTWRGFGAVRGEASRTAGVRMNAVHYMYRRPGDKDIAILDPAITKSPVKVHAAYCKGSTVMRTFEQRWGGAFTKALRELLQTAGPYGLSVAKLSAAIKKHTGVDPAHELDQWLRRPGFPRIKVTVSSDGTTLRAETKDAFTLTLPASVWQASGEERRLLVKVGESTTLSDPATPRPVLVELDPQWTAVREIKPTLKGDVSLDGRVDAVDLIEVALRHGATLPSERRVDGGYDPLHDINDDRTIDDDDLQEVVSAAR